MESGDCGWVRGRCLGRGSSGEVHLAVSTSGHGRSFAVKSAETRRAAALRKEFEILSSLRSPYVVSCLGSGVRAEADGRTLYNLFLEYVPGGSLAEVIRRRGGGGLDERAIGGYTGGIVRALAYLHASGVVHCDVKGHNVLVVAGERVKLADFGCARRGQKAPGAAVAGTPLFMAPEVARGEEQGPEADVWALGCTVIEMATGRPPWPDAKDPVAAVHRIAFSGDAPEIPAHLSAGAKDFLSKCLHRDPRMRWTAAELLDHPFICGREEDLEFEFSQESIYSASSPTKKRRSSPKSILDQDHWASWGSEDDDEPELRPAAEFQFDSAEERLGQLVGVSPSQSVAGDETWDENSWVTVRNGALDLDLRRGIASSSKESYDDEEQPTTSGEFPEDGRACAVGREECSPETTTTTTTTNASSPFNDCIRSSDDVGSCSDCCTEISIDDEFKEQNS